MYNSNKGITMKAKLTIPYNDNFDMETYESERIIQYGFRNRDYQETELCKVLGFVNKIQKVRVSAYNGHGDHITSEDQTFALIALKGKIFEVELFWLEILE